MGYKYTEEAGNVYLGMKTAMKTIITEQQENWVQRTIKYDIVMMPARHTNQFRELKQATQLTNLAPSAENISDSNRYKIVQMPLHSMATIQLSIDSVS